MAGELFALAQIQEPTLANGSQNCRMPQLSSTLRMFVCSAGHLPRHLALKSLTLTGRLENQPQNEFISN